MTTARHPNVPHPGTRTEAPNGEGTTMNVPEGETLDRPMMDGATEYYGADAAGAPSGAASDGDGAE